MEKDNSKYRCDHDNFSLKKLKESNNIFYYLDRLMDQDGFPTIQPGCTQQCKDKMKEIYQFCLGGYLKLIENYYDDAKIIEYGSTTMTGCSLGEYYGFLKGKNSDRSVMKLMNVGIVDDKPVRLCNVPEGSFVYEPTGETDDENILILSSCMWYRSNDAQFKQIL